MQKCFVIAPVPVHCFLITFFNSKTLKLVPIVNISFWRNEKKQKEDSVYSLNISLPVRMDAFSSCFIFNVSMLNKKISWFFSLISDHLSRRITMWAYSIPLEPASVRQCVCQCVCPSALSNMTISATSVPIAIKFNRSIRGWRKTALGFGWDRIRTLVSMATDDSHRVIIRKTLLPL